MNRKYFSALPIVGLAALLFAACSDDDNEAVQETNFTSYSIRGINGQTTTIDPVTKYVTVRLPDTVRSGVNLVPEFTVSEGTQASMNREVKESGTEALNFNNMQLYTVSTPDYSQSSLWHVVVTNNDYTASYGLGNFLTYWWSNNGTDPNGFYMEQQHTGVYSDENCGPAAAAMAVKWFNPSYSGGVEEARNSALVSEVDGGTWWYPRDVLNFIYNSGNRNVYYWDFNNASENGFINTICNLLERGNLCIVCLNMRNISTQEVLNHEYRANCYYSGNNGHFLVIKGYRVVNGVPWFEVHDPWGLDLKYSDGTYYGSNRYYLASEVASSRFWNRWTVVVPPPARSSSSAKRAANSVSHTLPPAKLEGHKALVGGGRDHETW